MNRDDLLKLLDLGGADAGPAPGGPPAGPLLTPADAGTGGPVSPTALEVDGWGLRRGRELHAASDRVRAAGADEYASADFLAAAFDPGPVLLPACADARRHAFLAAMLENDDYRALHAATRLDDAASEIAAVAFAEQFAGSKGGDADGAGGGGVGGDAAVLRAVAAALAAAGDEVGACREAAAAAGLGPGAPGSNDPRAVAAVYRRVRSDPTLRRVCELAGRYRRVAQSRQRRKAAGGGLDDVRGVVPGGDLSRLLPHELARLAVPDLEWDALRRLAEGEAACREHHAAEPVGRGPLIVAVDESGSMEGEKAHAAKGLALALAWVARRQRRWVGLVAYSGDTGERLLALPPGRWDESKVLDWAAAFLGGGSDLDVPVREMPRMYDALGAPRGATDVVFVTDCLCRIPDDVKRCFLAWKAAARARLLTLAVGGPAGDLAAVSDEVYAAADLSPGGDAVGRVLSH